MEQNTTLTYQSESKDSPFFGLAFVGPDHSLGAFLRADLMPGFAFHCVQSVPLTTTRTTEQGLFCRHHLTNQTSRGLVRLSLTVKGQ